MAGENENKEETENKDMKITENSSDQAAQVIPDKPFPEPKILEAVVDPKIKPKEEPITFSFTTPRDIHEKQAEPTKGDTVQAEEKKTPTIEEVREQIKKDETASPSAGYSDYYDNAEMLIDGWTAGLSSFANWFANDNQISAYEYPKVTSDKLKKQLTKVLIKRNTMLPIEVLFGGTLIGATAPILLKMTSRRKEFFAKKSKEEQEKPKEPAAPIVKEKTTVNAPGAGRPEKGYSRRKKV